MAQLKQLLRKRHVANHPMIQVALAKKTEQREIRKSIAQMYDPEADDGSLSDMFSETVEDENQGLDGGDQKLATLIYKASEVTQNLFDQFNFPLPPQLKFLNTYGVKRATTDEDRVVDAEIRLEAKIETIIGARRYIEIPVHIVRGMVIPPSIVYHEGKELLLTQGFVDHLIHTATAYALEPNRANWASPLIDRQELSMYTDMRNERGYQPRSYDDGFMTFKTSKRKRAQEVNFSGVIEGLVRSGEFGFGEESDIDGVFRAACDKVDGVYWDDDDVLHCIIANPQNQDFIVWWVDSSDNYMFDDFDNSGFIEDIVKGAITQEGVLLGEDGEIFDGVDIPEEVLLRAENAYSDPRQLQLLSKRKRAQVQGTEELRANEPGAKEVIDALSADQSNPNRLKLFASRKRAIKSGTPSGYSAVTELLEKAKEDGTDTFPRAYHYILRNYVLDVLPCVDNNHWEITLINDGWAINPYGRNRGRITADKQAQELDGYELELESAGDLVEFGDLNLPSEDYDVSDAEDDQPQLLDWFYAGTKTPVEISDNIKFEAHDGPIRAQIVELQIDADCVIVKSKGIEYRVHVEDIAPLDSTFKKMYLAQTADLWKNKTTEWTAELLYADLENMGPKRVYEQMPYLVEDYEGVSSDMFHSVLDKIIDEKGWDVIFRKLTEDEDVYEYEVDEPAY